MYVVFVLIEKFISVLFVFILFPSYFQARFSNIDSEDRIFINGCDLKSCEIHLEGRQEVEVELTWSPILSGYLRKTIRIFDINKKSRSFDVVLRGMAIDAKNVSILTESSTTE